MAVAQGPFLAAVLLLVSSWPHCSSPLPACPESCTCQSTPLLNCSSAGLSFVPRQIQDCVTDLDLSHNFLDSVTLDRPHRSLRNVWLGNNSITHLSLCMERSIRGRHVRRLSPRSRRGCVSWAPTLQLLSVERNQLEQLPQGLEGSESLQVLQLSFNRISTLQPGDLNHLRQLKELHLQHNLITSLHPQMFQDLAQLQVLDLSFNMLTSLHPLTYLSLRNTGADVQLDGNRWQCDCSMRSLRRRMAYDSSRGLQTWSVVCVSPSIISGRDLLQVEEHDLNCFSAEDGPELHRDVTVYSGSEILLSCSTQDLTWWTPSGQASVSQLQAGLLINDVTERDAGLYVCVSEEHEVVSVFNLQISKIGGARRKTRSLPRTSREIILQDTPNRIGQERNQSVTQSELALAVCLSVFITFLIAFILGVLARPCIDVLWGRITKKKSSSATHSVSSVEQRQYDNEAYCNGEEPEQIGAHRERRVTFSTVDYREDRNVQYYDTVAGGNQETINNDTVIECESRDTNTAGDSGSENSVRLSITEDNQRGGTDLSGSHTHSIEFEHIPDPVEQEKRRSLSSCSESSQSDKVTNKDQMTQRHHTTPKSNQLAEDSVQQRADSSTDIRIEVSQISVEGTSELPGFSSEPFADWSPHKNNTNLSDPELWQENEEQFEFSDSVHSTSARSSSVCGSFNDSKLILVPTYDKQRTGDLSSSSSYVSEDEPTQYTVNSDQEDEDKERNHNKPEVTNARLKQDASLEQQIHDVDSIKPAVRFNQDDYRYDTQRPVVRPEESFSSHSSDSDVQDYTVNKGRVPSLAVTSHSKSLDTGVPSPSAAYSSSSSSESEAEIKDLKVAHSTGRLNEGLKINKAETLSTDLDSICIPQIKKCVDIKAPFPASDSSSSDESTDETTKYIKKQEQGEVNMAELLVTEYQSVIHDAMKPQFPALDPAHATTTKRRAPLPPINSSSNGSSNETMDHQQKQGEMQMTRLPIKVPQTANHDSDTQWPALDLEDTTRIKRRLDIKAPSPPPDSSSSSDNEDETTKHTKRQEQVQMNMARPLGKVSETARYDPQTQWPLLDLEHTKPIKRRLDIKAPSPDSESSSSSDSEGETTHHTERPGKVEIAGPPLQESQTGSHDPDTMFPSIDLEHIPHIKRRLDIKAPSPPPDSSSSSDSEDETTKHTKRQEQVQMNMARPLGKVSETARYDPQTQWPLLDLEHTKHVKRRLDIKAPSPDSDSSSSSDSGDETTHHTEKPGKVEIAGPPLQESQTGSHDPETMFPSIDLEHIPHIKRRLDIKARSPPPDSSSSSDSEDETTHHTQRPGKVEITGFPFQESQTESNHPDTRWPSLDFEHTVHIKRRLDIKAPSPPPDSSSSSDSEEETINHINKQEQGQMNMARLPSKVPETARYNPQTQWPLLDLEHTKHVKRRLDIKAPSPDSDSSSSSHSEDETSGHKKKQRPVRVDIAEPPFEKSQTGSHDPDMIFPSIDLENIPHIKRRLDIKAPSPPLEPRSNSEIVEKHEQRKVHISSHPSQESQAESRDPDTRWPVIDLEHTMHVKRRLDVKAPPPSSESSSSSHSEDETTHQVKKWDQGETHMARPPIEVFQTVTYDPRTQWPLLDLQHTKHVKRRLDVKAPSPDTDSSSSSDSEDETTHHTERPRKVDFAEFPLQKSQTINQDPETQWPALDLDHNLRIKRRLDIKAPSPVSDSSSSSDSEDETTHSTKIERPGVVGVAGLPFQESQTVSRDPETQWPTVDLGNITRIKRRLDIKALSPPPDSLLSDGSTNHTVEGKREAIKISPGHSSSSSDEQEKGTKDLRYPRTTVEPDSSWPRLDLNSDLNVKRRLDIRAHSPPSESSSSSDESGTTKLPKTDVGITSRRPEGKMPDLKVNVPPVKRRLNIKAPSPQPDRVLSSVSPSNRQSESNSSRSDSEDEHRDQAKPGLGVSTMSKATEKELIRARKIPVINISPRPKTDHNIKLEKYTVVTDDVGVKTSDNISRPQEINPELQSRWATMDLGISRFRKRLEITSQTREPPNLPSSPPPDSPSSSSSESGTGSKSSKTRQTRKGVGMQGIIHTQSSATAENKPVNVSSNLKGWNDNSGNSADNHTSLHVAQAVNIKMDQPQSQTEEVQRKTRIELKSQTSEDSHSRHPNMGLTNIPHIKRTLDIRAPLQRESSSSSNSEDDMMSHSVPDLSLGVPRVKRRLDIKGPSPEPSNSSSSSSESENEVTRYTVNQSRYPSNMPGMTDSDHVITYKRLIMKPSSPLGNSFTPSGMDQTIDHTKQRYTGTAKVNVAQQGPFHSVGDRDAYLSPKRVPSMSFDDVVKKRLEQSRSTTDLDMPPEIRWTGIGRQLSDLSLPGPRRHLDAGFSSPQQAPPAKPEVPPPDSPNSSSSDSDDNIKQDRGKADVTLTHKHSSLIASSVSLASSRALDKFDSPPSSTSELLRALSEDKNKRKGLSALRAMSSERQKWDTVDKGASPPFDDHSPQGDTDFIYRRSEEDVKPLAKQPPTQLRLPSTLVDVRRATDLLYDIPHYRRHDMRDTEPPQRASPPIPATPPPPYEAVGLSRRSPQSSKTQGLESARSYLQHIRKTEESTSSSLASQNLAVYFDSSNANISEV